MKRYYLLFFLLTVVLSTGAKKKVTNHLYRCERVRYIDGHIESPTFGDYHAPSSDAIDLDVCDDVVVRGCYMNICDDAVCLQSSK